MHPERRRLGTFHKSSYSTIWPFNGKKRNLIKVMRTIIKD